MKQALIYSFFAIATLSTISQAATFQESHLRGVLASWAGVDGQSVTSDMSLRDLWLENHTESLFHHFDTTGSEALSRALQRDSLFGSCQSSTQAGEFGCLKEVCGDIQTVRQLYERLINCSGTQNQ